MLDETLSELRRCKGVTYRVVGEGYTVKVNGINARVPGFESVSVTITEADGKSHDEDHVDPDYVLRVVRNGDWQVENDPHDVPERPQEPEWKVRLQRERDKRWDEHLADLERRRQQKRDTDQ